ncbi:MAG TPA: RpiB/LacA/LacB family sugar-phosphate isomerase, partial [Candidatus Eisenbacteria bacterium]|nr:RpiB/LacA/LacB family sugar-phosphate isomerase [Candidatus Eisenbacteria bacterium]
MKIAIASDHAGFDYKEKIKALLNDVGHEVRDFGVHERVRHALDSLAGRVELAHGCLVAAFSFASAAAISSQDIVRFLRAGHAYKSTKGLS